ncbi:MAG TPA: hypothetical protein VE077_07125 [Candidatus Methylomirabilis sp.]|nr:hypothetical protein [Candidatus Methylomirabilis sp.]
MTIRSSQPPWEFLLTASRNSLQSFELSRLSHAAELRKELAALLNQWIEENSAAMLARWLLEQRDRSARTPEALSEKDSRVNGTHAASDNFFTDRGVSQPANAAQI